MTESKELLPLYMTKSVKSIAELRVFLDRFEKWIDESNLSLEDIDISLNLNSILEKKPE